MKFEKHHLWSIVLYPMIIISTDTNINLPVVDSNETQEVDFSYFNDPYLLKQEQPNFSLSNNAENIISSDSSAAIVDSSETRDVDYSYFNDPYAFEAFRKDLPVKAKFSGYIQYSSWWDSRQNATLGDGYALLYPKKRLFDVDCRDINARGEFNMTMIETRARVELFGPTVLKAKSFAYLETDVFGVDLVINRWHIRDAFIEFTWEKVKILLGQFWHPLFVVKTFPLTVSFDQGSPVAVYSRDPQITITAFNKKGSELVLAASSQLEFISNGPIGLSSTYLRNSRVPNLTLRLSKESKHNYCGFGLNFMRLKPRLESDKGFKVHESINSMCVTAFDTLKFEPFELRSQLIYAQNANNLALLGGFAVHSINPTTDERTYANLSAISYWFDINIAKKIEPGLFIGVAKNLGARHTIISCIVDPATGIEESTIYGPSFDGEQINMVIRVAPRIRFHILPVDFAGEIEYTRAGYGCINRYGRIDNVDPVANTRVIFTAYYYF